MNKLWHLLIVGLLAWSSSVTAADTTVPATMEQAYKALDSLLSPKDREFFMQTPEQTAVANAHRRIGVYIRNHWFHSGNSPLVGLLHQAGARAYDDMSSMVLTSYWRPLNQKSIQLQEQGACYLRWSIEQDRLEKEAIAKGENSYGTPSFTCP